MLKCMTAKGIKGGIQRFLNLVPPSKGFQLGNVAKADITEKADQVSLVHRLIPDSLTHMPIQKPSQRFPTFIQGQAEIPVQSL